MEAPTISKVSEKSIKRAVDALLKWNSKKSDTQKPKLLPSDEFLYLVLTLNKIPSKNRTNAHKITLPNPLYTPESSEFCLFVHDAISQSAKQKIEEQKIPVSKVIKLSKLKKDYKAFEQKRKLCDSFDLFFSDKRIIPLLPNVLGKQFYSKKKIPVPIELGRSNWKEQIETVCGSAMLYLSTGTCSVIKVAKASMTRDQIVENVAAAINGVAETVPKKWGNVRAFHLKFPESLALPMYQQVPGLGLKISSGGLMTEESGGGDDKTVVVATPKKEESKQEQMLGSIKKKGRIHEVRYMDNAEAAGDEMVGEDESGRDVDQVAGKKRKIEVAKLKKGLKKNKVLV